MNDLARHLIPGHVCGGDCIIERVYDGDREYLVVEQADESVCVSSELLRQIVEGRAWGTAFSEGVMVFGTEGKGLGVVTYEVDDPWFMDWLRGRVKVEWLTMRRVYQSGSVPRD